MARQRRPVTSANKDGTQSLRPSFVVGSLLALLRSRIDEPRWGMQTMLSFVLGQSASSETVTSSRPFTAGLPAATRHLSKVAPGRFLLRGHAFTEVSTGCGRMSSGSFRLFPEPAPGLGLRLQKQRQAGGDLDPGRIAPQPQHIIPNVAGGVDVRIGCVPAGDAAERVPVRPVVRVDMAASIASLAGVAAGTSSRMPPSAASFCPSLRLVSPRPRSSIFERLRPAFWATF